MPRSVIRNNYSISSVCRLASPAPTCSSSLFSVSQLLNITPPWQRAALLLSVACTTLCTDCWDGSPDLGSLPYQWRHWDFMTLTARGVSPLTTSWVESQNRSSFPAANYETHLTSSWKRLVFLMNTVLTYHQWASRISELGSWTY